jgi:Uma2 family endonuclease
MALTVPKGEVVLLTFEDYIEDFHREPVEVRRCEILDGVKYQMTSPTWWHQNVLGNLYVLLRQYQARSKRGNAIFAPLDVLIRKKPLRVRQPDALFISKERLESAGGAPKSGPLMIAPELVIEILSPSETEASLQAKIADYCFIGVLEFWLVNSINRTLEVFRLSETGAKSVRLYGQDQSFSSLAFPDLEIALAEVFASE